MRTRHLVFIVATMMSSVCFAEENVVAEGVGQGVNREEALMAAKRNAVETGIGTVLLSRTEVENFMLKRDQIITKTMGSVRSYDVLSETKTTDGLFEIKINAVLSRSSMHNDLADLHILIESMNKPRIMILVQENNVGNDEPANSAAETALIGFFKEPYDFELVDPQVVASIRSSAEQMAQVAGDPQAAAALASRHGAEVIIAGNAVSRKAEGISQNLGGMVSVQADVTLRAINCSSGRIIGSSNAHAARVHISPNTAGDQAIAKASVKAGKTLLDHVMKDWQNQINNGIPLTVSVKNVTTFRTKKAAMQTLEALSGVSAVRERGWDDQSKILEVDIQYKGNADGFCTKVDGLKMRTGGGSLGVSGIKGNAITISAKVM